MAIGLNPEIRRDDSDMRLPAVDIGIEATLETEEGEEDRTVPAGVEAAVELTLL